MQSLYVRPVLRCSSAGASWSEQAKTLPSGALLNTLRATVSLLDGKHELDEISGEMVSGGFSLDDTFAALSWLDRQGLIAEAADERANALSDEERRLYASQMDEFSRWAKGSRLMAEAPPDSTGLVTQLALKRAVVVLIGSGLASESLIRLLAAIGVGSVVILDESAKESSGDEWPDVLQGRQNAEAQSATINPFVRLTWVTRFVELSATLDDAPPNLLVYCSDQFDPVACTEINRICLDHAVPWLLYRRRLHEVDIGPLIIPRETACFVCYDNRMRAISPSIYAEDDSQDLNLPRLNLPLGTDLLALEVLKFLTGAIEPVTYGRLWRLDMFSGLLELHPVLKLPRCPACGMYRVRPAHKLWEERDGV